MSVWGALIVAAVGAVLTAVIAFPLGIARGKRQTRHNEQVRIVDEIRRDILDMVPTLRLAAVTQDETWRMDLKSKRDNIQNYYRDNSVWLTPRRAKRIGDIIDGYVGEANRVLWQPPADDPDRLGHPDEIPPNAYDWSETEGKRLAGELEKEARRLLGTERASWWRRIIGG